MTLLLDSEGAITDQFEVCLRHIFGKYCTPQAEVKNGLLDPPANAVMTAQGLDAWATDTNGSPFSDDTKEEMLEFLDVTDSGDLTFKGFLQIYQLQTENEEDETWNDLVGPFYMLRNGSDGRG